MDLRIERKWKKDTYTIGNLYYKENDSDEWKFICNTLEDKDRGLDCMMSEEEIKAKKVYAQTAIPTGKYKVFLKQVSPRFQYSSWAKPYGGCVPRIMNVKSFSGVLFHPGNYAGKETFLKKIQIPQGKPVYDRPEYVKGGAVFKNTYGVDLPEGKYSIKAVDGNYEIYTVKDDTEGCVLLGENKVKGGVINSQLCFHKFMDIVKRDEDGMLGLEII